MCMCLCVDVTRHVNIPSDAPSMTFVYSVCKRVLCVSVCDGFAFVFMNICTFIFLSYLCALYSYCILALSQ